MQLRDGMTMLKAKLLCKVCEDMTPVSELNDYNGMCWGCWCDWRRTDPEYLQGQAEYRMEDR